jgi:molecular chaperone DnaK (HSP70)
MAMSSGNKVVIGLDFGTTYRSVLSSPCSSYLHLSRSAVAYSDQVDGGCNINAIQAIVDWPGPRSTNEKVPSRISYGPPPAVEIKWGYQIKPNDRAKPHVLMKLKLDERLKRSKQMSLLLKFLAGLESLSIDDLDSDDEDEPPEYPGKSPVEVVADYLSEVRKHAWAKLEVKYGAELFRTLTKELVITVPAVWSERAKDLTLKAVTKAQWDVSKIAIVTEPEAAAVYTLKYMSSGVQQDQIKVNDHFVLVDAGGGTVDLISYKVTRIAPTYGVEEAVVGSGDKFGATFVEKEFLNWLNNWIGEEAYKKIPPRQSSDMEID